MLYNANRHNYVALKNTPHSSLRRAENLKSKTFCRNFGNIRHDNGWIGNYCYADANGLLTWWGFAWRFKHLCDQQWNCAALVDLVADAEWIRGNQRFEPHNYTDVVDTNTLCSAVDLLETPALWRTSSVKSTICGSISSICRLKRRVPTVVTTIDLHLIVILNEFIGERRAI